MPECLHVIMIMRSRAWPLALILECQSESHDKGGRKKCYEEQEKKSISVKSERRGVQACTYAWHFWKRPRHQHQRRNQPLTHQICPSSLCGDVTLWRCSCRLDKQLPPPPIPLSHFLTLMLFLLSTPYTPFFVFFFIPLIHIVHAACTGNAPPRHCDTVESALFHRMDALGEEKTRKYF